MFPQKSCIELEEIIFKWNDGERLGTNDGMGGNQYFLKFMQYFSLDDRETIEKAIRLLQGDLTRNEVQFKDMRAGISMMIAYACCKLEDQQQTFYYAKFATDQWLFHPNPWDKALTHWFLGIVYRNNNDFEKTKNTLTTAKELLEEHAIDSDKRLNYKTRDLCREYIHRIEQSINDLTEHQNILSPKLSQKEQVQKTKTDKKSWVPPWGTRQESREAPPQPTPFRTNDSKITQVNSFPQGSKERAFDKGASHKKAHTSQREKSKQKPQHIIIPVDIQALNELNADSILLEPDLFQKLQSYGENKESNVRQRPPRLHSEIEPPRKKHVRIPRFPIYGQAAAGPSGKPNLDAAELEKADIVYDDLCINFSGKEYGIRFIIENEEYNFLDWRRYGWLQVIGESMNQFSPIPIKDGNFILFAENRDVNSCVMKIIVAVLPELDAQPAQLVVKQLLKSNTQLPSRMDGLTPKYSKYMLHSKSSLDRDPLTGMSYKRDIEIIKDNQVVGEVIAIASPTET